jgi:GMP synthase-like glutamine amidotransferase
MTPSHADPVSILIVLNAEHGSPGRFAPWLAEAGARTTVVSKDDIPLGPEGYDGVILLGGGLMPDDDEKAPWLRRERSLAQGALAAGTPVLGVCLGGQLIAHVSGGEVRASFGAPERGSVPIRTLPGADEDPVFGGLPEHFPAIEHHQDRITELPPGAVHLAASDACPLQAFRLGDTAWGLQFHPETPPERLRTWDAEELRAQGIDRDALVEAALAADAEAVPAARTLLERWLGVVREVAADRGFPVIDGHNDLAWERRISQDYSLEHLDDDELTFQTDLPALRRGGVVGQFWSVFVDCEVADPLQSTLQQIDYVHRMIERHPEHLRLAFTSTEVKEAIASGRIASLLGAEGGHSIVDDLAVLRLFARLGVRYLTLTHNEDTPWADSATGQHPHGGLTDRGREIVAELERNSILVDLSHVSPATMHDALDVATRPVTRAERPPAQRAGRRDGAAPGERRGPHAHVRPAVPLAAVARVVGERQGRRGTGGRRRPGRGPHRARPRDRRHRPCGARQRLRRHQQRPARPRERLLLSRDRRGAAAPGVDPRRTPRPGLREHPASAEADGSRDALTGAFRALTRLRLSAAAASAGAVRASPRGPLTLRR